VNPYFFHLDKILDKGELKEDPILELHSNRDLGMQFVKE